MLSGVAAFMRPFRRRVQPLQCCHLHAAAAASAQASETTEVVVGNFTSLKNATPVEFNKAMKQFGRIVTPESQTQRILRKFESQKGIQIGNILDLYDHGLQSATRAFRDGADEETVVVALLHDIGELEAPNNHGEDAAGLTVRDTRERFRDHKYFAACEEFCERWDQPAFDPNYENLPLEHFVPMVERLLSKKPYWFVDELDELSQAKADIAGGYPQHVE